MQFSSGKCTVPTERIRHSKVFHLLSAMIKGFPGGSVSEDPACQCRRPRFDPWVEKILWRRKWQPTVEFLPGKSHGQRSRAGHSPCSRRVGHNLRTETTTTIMIKTSGCVSCASKQCFPWWKLGFPMAVQVWHPYPGSSETVNHFIGISNCVLFNWSLFFLLQFTFSWTVGGKKDFKKCYMLMISFLTAILSAPFCTYMIMKQFAWNLHLFKFRKLPCWERTPALLNTTLINHSYRVDITFLLNSQWAGKLALPAITILISLGNVFIYKVLLPYLEPFIHTLLTKERAFLCALVINHICDMMWPHWQAPASDRSSSFTINIHRYFLSRAFPWTSSLYFQYNEKVSILTHLQDGYWQDWNSKAIRWI